MSMKPPVRSRCRCCAKPLPHGRRPGKDLLEHCDVICFAAEAMLTHTGIEYWRRHCNALTITRAQARFEVML
jgi:hypothetical protein